MKLKEISPSNRPMERLVLYGERNLSTAELFAIILKTGTRNKNIIDLSNELLSKFNINTLSNCTITELKSLKGIGVVKAAQIKAIFEIHKRINDFKIEKNKIFKVDQVYDLVKEDLQDKEQENLLTVFLKNNNFISKKIITIGTSNETLISQKDIIRYAIKENANAIIIAHNHPSGNKLPSQQDKLETNKLIKIANQLNISVLDHLIITKDGFFSFKQNNIL